MARLTSLTPQEQYIAHVDSQDLNAQPRTVAYAPEIDLSPRRTAPKYEQMQARVSQSVRKTAELIQKPKKPLRETLRIGAGQTVAGQLQEHGVSGPDAYKIVEHLGKHMDVRKIRPGQTLDLFYTRKAEDERVLDYVQMDIDPVRLIKIHQRGEQYQAELVEKELKKRTYAYNMQIESSLYGSAVRTGIPPRMVAEMIRVYSWSVDFQRDIRSGDSVEVLYEVLETEDGEIVGYGDLLYANLAVKGKDKPIYRFEMKDGRVDYFGPDGRSVKKVLMKTPIDGARISSGYGMRKHPILGYNKMHKGMDFAAATGTPIFAAGEGVVEYVGRRGGYGNYIRLRHNSKLKTAYAHLNKYAKGLKKGQRVQQGDVIGYVGSTGRSTGPHLHYEVIVNNEQVNPQSVDLPTGEELAGEELRAFKVAMKNMSQQYIALTEGLKYAGNEIKSNIN